MKRLQFIILSLTMLCTGMVMANIESYANDPPGINIGVDMNFDVVAENFQLIQITDEGVFTVYSCDLTLWPEVAYSVTISQNSAIIVNFTRISVLNKKSAQTDLYVYTLLRHYEPGLGKNPGNAFNNITENDRMPMKASGGRQSHSFLRNQI